MTTQEFYQLLADTRVQAHIDANDTALDCVDFRPNWGDLCSDYYFAHCDDWESGYLAHDQLLDIARVWADVYYATALQIWARYDAQSATEFACEVW